ncbi:MAG: limonene-1,2-epoxide hydrolase [Crocinitomix sp. MedPE-SWsnd]|nr:MAG: limonene-1,2-epoxide hydrolase [Crocinitomix sp. MedPE-SWsnd]
MNVIEKFYTAFKDLDAEGMAACYHEEVVFEDPAFGELKGIHAGNMWRMLLESQKGKEFMVNFSNVKSDAEKGSASWEAFYNFSKANRKVHNKIEAKFKLKDGLIIDHRDDFNVKTWAKQAMGFKGVLIGRTKFFKRKLNAQTNGMLAKWEAKQ